MSPVFGHGRLRLYLLKLLDEAPRHGYEVIRLLQDRFMGVYAPSPGTIYPRLARLEEEGLLTHDEEDGRKIYRITDKGREEINRRLDELDDLEREITESVSGIAREVKEDVRETVRSLREELTWATREVHKETKRSAQEQARQTREEARERARRVREELRQSHGQEHEPAGSEAEERAGREWAKSGWQDWGDWASWTDWPGRRRRPDAFGGRDFERLAREFGNEVRRAVRQAGALGEGAMDDLRAILEEALQRIRSEVFGPLKPQDEPQRGEPDSGEPDAVGSGAAATAGQPGGPAGAAPAGDSASHEATPGTAPDAGPAGTGDSPATE